MTTVCVSNFQSRLGSVVRCREAVYNLLTPQDIYQTRVEVVNLNWKWFLGTSKATSEECVWHPGMLKIRRPQSIYKYFPKQIQYHIILIFEKAWENTLGPG